MIGFMAIAIALPEFNGFERDLYFSFQRQMLFTIISTLFQKPTKNQRGK